MVTQNAVDVPLSGSTGTGNFVGANTPTLITPVIGAATGTSLSVSGAISSTGGDITTSYGNAGANVVIGATNTNSANTASHAVCDLTSTGAGGGSPYVSYTIGGVRQWLSGVHNDGGDSFKITQSGAFGIQDRLSIDTSGNANISGYLTVTTQPAFRGYLGSSITNASGTGTNIQLGSGTALTEVFDRGGNFNTNGTFTAPVAGIYHFDFGVVFTNCTIASLIQPALVADGVTYSFQFARTAGTQNFGWVGSTTVSMSASSTAVVTVNTFGEAGDTNTLFGSSAQLTFFAGYLVC